MFYIYVYRGYLQRVKFKIQLALFREEKQKWSMIENFSKLVQKGYKVHRNFEPACDLSPEGVVVTTQGDIFQEVSICFKERSLL